MGNPICAFTIVRTKLAKQFYTFVDSMICKLSLAQYSGRNFVDSNYSIPRKSVKDLLLVSRYQIRFQFPQLGVLLTFDLFVLSPKRSPSICWRQYLFCFHCLHVFMTFYLY